MEESPRLSRRREESHEAGVRLRCVTFCTTNVIVALSFGGRLFKLRSQETGKRIYRRKPQNEWHRTEVPAQRIVSDELWNAVQRRMQFVNELYALEARRPGILRARAASSPYLFSGLLKCSL